MKQSQRHAHARTHTRAHALANTHARGTEGEYHTAHLHTASVHVVHVLDERVALRVCKETLHHHPTVFPIPEQQERGTGLHTEKGVGVLAGCPACTEPGGAV